MQNKNFRGIWQDNKLLLFTLEHFTAALYVTVQGNTCYMCLSLPRLGPHHIASHYLQKFLGNCDSARADNSNKITS